MGKGFSINMHGWLQVADIVQNGIHNTLLIYVALSGTADLPRCIGVIIITVGASWVIVSDPIMDTPPQPIIYKAVHQSCIQLLCSPVALMPYCDADTLAARLATDGSKPPRLAICVPEAAAARPARRWS